MTTSEGLQLSPPLRSKYPAYVSQECRALRRLFSPGADVRPIAEDLSQAPEDAVREIAAFVLSSPRGLCAGFHRR